MLEKKCWEKTIFVIVNLLIKINFDLFIASDLQNVKACEVLHQ